MNLISKQALQSKGYEIRKADAITHDTQYFWVQIKDDQVVAFQDGEPTYTEDEAWIDAHIHAFNNDKD